MFTFLIPLIFKKGAVWLIHLQITTYKVVCILILMIIKFLKFLNPYFTFEKILFSYDGT